jgi:two-component system, chemotaxis family, protein-glutamate methylesterase/glutaminase
MARARADTQQPVERLIVIGASMGGVEALGTLFGRLPPVAAAIVVVLHRSGGSTALANILERVSKRPAHDARDGEPLLSGRIYVAPVGFHTIVEPSRLRVKMGPRINGHRPSIDVLFHSAAESFGNRAIGVVLSGALDCGAIGLWEIKRAGGLAVVQDPASAMNPQMPQSALDHTKVDRIAAPGKLGPLLGELVERPPPRARRQVADLPRELAAFVCPECNGPIWRVGGRQFRCRVGHTFSPDGFFAAKERRLEAALWEALNAMNERRDLCHRMSAQARAKGHDDVADNYEWRANETAHNAKVLRELVDRTNGELRAETEARAVDRARPRAAKAKARRRKKG